MLAVDLPGLGRSQQRADLLTPTAMGGFLLAVLDAFDLRRPRLVAPDIGTSAAAVPLAVAGILADIIAMPTVDLDPAAVMTDVVNSISPPLPDHVRDDYTRSYAGERFAESCRYVRSYPTELPLLADKLAGITTPVQILTGADDPFVPVLNGEYLQRNLPDSVLHVLAAEHFPWEKVPEQYGGLVRAWAADHPA